MNVTGRLYLRYAATLLGLTLLAGLHMRAAMVLPVLRGGLSGPNLVHAHSHAAFFGWAVMGVFALVTGRLVLRPVLATAHRVLAHVTGVASAAAFVGFALRGYDGVTIALSAFHVLLWVTFTALVWRDVASAPAALRPFVRAGLVFLVAAGLATLAPMVVMVRGTTDPWLQQFAVKLFLTPFVTGFLLLCAMGAVHAAATSSRHARVVIGLIACGTFPSTALYVSAVPPQELLGWMGRGGIAFVAAGTLLFACDVLTAGRTRALPPLAWLVAFMALAKGGLELLAALGVGASFMHNRAITIAVLHLVLLGVVTPALVLGLRPTLHAPMRTIGFGVALLGMTAAVGVTGWPWAARLMTLRGISVDTLLLVAAATGTAAALLLLALLLPSGYSNARTSGSPMRAVRAGRIHDAMPSPAGEPTRLTRAP